METLNSVFSGGPLPRLDSLFYWVMAFQMAVFIIPAVWAWVRVVRRPVDRFRPVSVITPRDGPAVAVNRPAA